MPLGFERLNERTQRPNANINFIKPLSSASASDQKTAQTFLERIAAQCYPVMKENYISVMALEEYPPNPEFIGRNFNAGEVIQLVLKDKAGRWLSLKFVQMVMMHELAHCKQMNHSRYFWTVRNKYADRMKELWDKEYTGEGMWGRGQSLKNGGFVHDRMPDKTDIPEHLCGGSYRRARKRKRGRGQGQGQGQAQDRASEKPKLSYAERQQNRIAKKFGVHGDGHGLGGDELLRGAFEQGRRSQGKPKVANSKRGRELRAAAALMRFGAAKAEAKEQTPEIKDDIETESDSSVDESVYSISNSSHQAIKDEAGLDMIRVCGDEGEEDDGGQREIEELQSMRAKQDSQRNDEPTIKTEQNAIDTIGDDVRIKTESEDDSTPDAVPSLSSHETVENAERTGTDTSDGDAARGSGAQERVLDAGSIATGSPPTTSASHDHQACPICSLENESSSPTCIACSNVLRPSLMPNSWRCKSDTCKGSQYINAADVGRCGLCGTSRPIAKSNSSNMSTNKSETIGITAPEVLRW